MSTGWRIFWRVGALTALWAVVSCAPLPPPLPPGDRGLLPEERRPAISEPTRAVDDGYLKIGILLPLSGPDAALGITLWNAAQAALFAAAQPHVMMLPRDTRGTPEGAGVAAEAVLAEGASIILGPLYSTAVSAVAQHARPRGVPVISFSTDGTVAGDGVYVMGFRPEEQTARIISYALAQGLRKFAALIPADDYGERVLRVLQTMLLEGGGELVRIEMYERDTQAVFEPVRRLADYDQRRRALREERADLRAMNDDLADEALELLSNHETLGELSYEAVFLPEGGPLLSAIGPLLPYYDVDPAEIRFLGTGLWDDPNVMREPALGGAWYAGPSPAAGTRLRALYSELFGYEPPRIASLAYDAVALVIALSAGGETWFPSDRLTDPKGYAGIDGIFRFHHNGAAERALAVVEVQPGRLKILSPADTTFQKPAAPRARTLPSSHELGE